MSPADTRARVVVVPRPLGDVENRPPDPGPPSPSKGGGGSLCRHPVQSDVDRVTPRARSRLTRQLAADFARGSYRIPGPAFRTASPSCCCPLAVDTRARVVVSPAARGRTTALGPRAARSPRVASDGPPPPIFRTNALPTLAGRGSGGIHRNYWSPAYPSLDVPAATPGGSLAPVQEGLSSSAYRSGVGSTQE